MTDNIPVIAIDGLASSGKSSVSKLLSNRLKYFVLDSGILYRAIAYIKIKEPNFFSTKSLLKEVINNIYLKPSENLDFLVTYKDKDISNNLYEEEIGLAASEISKNEDIRNLLLPIQQGCVNMPGLIANGRDMGTKVFPNAILKLYFTANLNIRAERRYKQLLNNDSTANIEDIKKSLQDNNIEVQTFNGHLLNEPWEVQNNSGQYFKVFTPYWRKAYEVYQSKKYRIKDITHIKPLKHQEKFAWNFLPPKKWYLKFENYWTPGEDAALLKLAKYIDDDIDNYKEGRDRPDLDQTSKLSPHLRFGEISPRKIVDQIVKSKKQNDSVKTFLSEIGWREFSYSLLYYSKDLANDPINEKFKKFPWRKGEKEYRLWKNAKTGIPLIDAAMKQIYEKGWMHNRLRMVVGSFLVKNLLLNNVGTTVPLPLHQ